MEKRTYDLPSPRPRHSLHELCISDPPRKHDTLIPDKLELFLQRVDATEGDLDLKHELKEGVIGQKLIKEGHMLRRQAFQKLPRYCALIGDMFVICKEEKASKYSPLVIKQILSLTGAHIKADKEVKDDKVLTFILKIDSSKEFVFSSEDAEWFVLLERAIAEPHTVKKANPRLQAKAIMNQMELEVLGWMTTHDLTDEDVVKVTSIVLVLLGVNPQKGQAAVDELKVQLESFSPPPGFKELIVWKKEGTENEDPLLRQAKEQNVLDMFLKLDKNSDNKLSYGELRPLLYQMGHNEVEAKELFEAIDKEDDGFISQSALREHFLNKQRSLAVAAKHGLSHSQILELRAVFSLLDQDDSGSIDASELEAIVKALGAKNVERSAIEKLIATIDGDGNGSIDFEEFCEMVTKQQSVFGLFDMTKLWVLEQALTHGSITPFKSALEVHFPGSLTQHEFVDQVADVVAKYGFLPRECISCVSLCRDEITSPLGELIQAKFASSFTFSSLGGSLTCGKTGFSAAHHHAPIVNGREKYVYFAMPHIAIDAFGDVGVVRRPGRTKESTACGALVAFRSQILSGHLNLSMDNNDIEMSILKQKVFGVMPYGSKPSLVELTKYTLEAIVQDLKTLIGLTVDINHSDYAVVTGVQIHGPKWLDSQNRPMAGDMDYVWPGEIYCVKDGVKHPLSLSSLLP